MWGGPAGPPQVHDPIQFVIKTTISGIGPDAEYGVQSDPNRKSYGWTPAVAEEPALRPRDNFQPHGSTSPRKVPYNLVKGQSARQGNLPSEVGVAVIEVEGDETA